MSSFKNDCERIKYYYDHGWATLEQVGLYVYYGVLTPEDYKTITDEEYNQE